MRYTQSLKIEHSMCFHQKNNRLGALEEPNVLHSFTIRIRLDTILHCSGCLPATWWFCFHVWHDNNKFMVFQFEHTNKKKTYANCRREMSRDHVCFSRLPSRYTIYNMWCNKMKIPIKYANRHSVIVANVLWMLMLN